MAATLLLDVSKWDLVLDADGNLAVATEPYALAQDAASVIKTFQGEVYWNTDIGVPYLANILAKRPPITLLKTLFEAAAATVPGVASTKCFLSGFANRRLTGQVQVSGSATGPTAAANFATIDPQGV